MISTFSYPDTLTKEKINLQNLFEAKFNFIWIVFMLERK